MVTPLIQKYSTFYGTRKFIAVFTTATGSYPELDECIPHFPILFHQDPF
jgi:hypothetical protein